VAVLEEEEALETEDQEEEEWTGPGRVLVPVVNVFVPNVVPWRRMRSEFPATTRTARSAEPRW
jgi:hypothetical protein